ncbi:MAG: OmpA family protein [Burkholderiaceae bacterium]|nr:OmpA family protein [Burkholderiaceae bacterium]
MAGTTRSTGKADDKAAHDSAAVEESETPKASATIYFEGDEVEVAEAYRAMIRQCAQSFNDKPAGMLIVSGHASSFDEPDEEVQLSLRRTRRVARLLERYGVASHQIVCVSRGANEPLVDPADTERRWINRRVEVKEGSRVPRPPAWAQQRKKRKADAAAKEADREASLERMIEKATEIRAAARKAAKKSGANRPETKEAPARTSAKTAPVKKAAAKTAPVKKAAAKTAPVKKAAAKTAAAKKAPAKKPASKTPPAKKAIAKKAPAKKIVAKKAAAKKAPAKLAAGAKKATSPARA